MYAAGQMPNSMKLNVLEQVQATTVLAAAGLLTGCQSAQLAELTPPPEAVRVHRHVPEIDLVLYRQQLYRQGLASSEQRPFFNERARESQQTFAELLNRGYGLVLEFKPHFLGNLHHPSVSGSGSNELMRILSAESVGGNVETFVSILQPEFDIIEELLSDAKRRVQLEVDPQLQKETQSISVTPISIFVHRDDHTEKVIAVDWLSSDDAIFAEAFRPLGDTYNAANYCEFALKVIERYRHYAENGGENFTQAILQCTQARSPAQEIYFPSPSVFPLSDIQLTNPQLAAVNSLLDEHSVLVRYTPDGACEDLDLLRTLSTEITTRGVVTLRIDKDVFAQTGGRPIAVNGTIKEVLVMDGAASKHVKFFGDVMGDAKKLAPGATQVTLAKKGGEVIVFSLAHPTSSQPTFLPVKLPCELWPADAISALLYVHPDALAISNSGYQVCFDHHQLISGMSDFDERIGAIAAGTKVPAQLFGIDIQEIIKTLRVVDSVSPNAYMLSFDLNTLTVSAQLLHQWDPASRRLCGSHEALHVLSSHLNILAHGSLEKKYASLKREWNSQWSELGPSAREAYGDYARYGMPSVLSKIAEFQFFEMTNSAGHPWDSCEEFHASLLNSVCNSTPEAWTDRISSLLTNRELEDMIEVLHAVRADYADLVRQDRISKEAPILTEINERVRLLEIRLPVHSRIGR